MDLLSLPGNLDMATFRKHSLTSTVDTYLRRQVEYHAKFVPGRVSTYLWETQHRDRRALCSGL